MKKVYILGLLAISILLVVGCKKSAEQSVGETASATEDTSAFTTLTDVVTDAILEIRYFGTYNFVGDRIDGYQEPTALLTKRAADSLKAVSDDVISLGYRLKIYDAAHKRPLTTSSDGLRIFPILE